MPHQVQCLHHQDQHPLTRTEGLHVARGALGQTVGVRQFLIFILVLIGINVVLALFGSPMRISIIGSIVLTLIVGGIMGATNRRR